MVFEFKVIKMHTKTQNELCGMSSMILMYIDNHNHNYLTSK